MRVVAVRMVMGGVLMRVIFTSAPVGSSGPRVKALNSTVRPWTLAVTLPKPELVGGMRR